MIFFLIAFLLIATILQVKMGKWALKKLSCSIKNDSFMVEPDDPFVLHITIQNRAKYPIFFLKCRFTIPLEVSLSGKNRGEIVTLAKTAEYHFSCFLMPNQIVDHRVRMTIGKRGGYRFENLVLSAGDFFGLKEQEAKYPGNCEVVILPRYPETGIDTQVIGGLLGEHSVRRWIHEDPILSSGFSEYTGREPLKTINWNRSLQSGKLMVRKMDFTSEEKVTVLLSVAKGMTSDVENCYSLCRAVCEKLEQQNLSYAFLHNGMLQSAVGILPTVEAGVGRQHLGTILEGLGRALPYASDTLSSLVQKAILRERDSSCYLLLVPEVTVEVRQAIIQLESLTGGSVQLICGGLSND